MQDVVVGLLAVGIGLIVALRGYFAMRIIIPIWGAFAGFMLGAGLMDAFTDDGFLRHALAWFVGFAMALLFATIAYLYYEVSVLVAMTAIGFALGTSAMVALGVTWSWAIILVGVITGAVLALIAIVGDMPTVILVILTALGGASTAVFGLMLLTGIIDTSAFDSTATTEQLDDDWWWYALYVAVAITGIVVQLRTVEQVRSSLRAEWARSGGSELNAG